MIAYALLALALAQALYASRVAAGGRAVRRAWAVAGLLAMLASQDSGQIKCDCQRWHEFSRIQKGGKQLYEDFAELIERLLAEAVAKNTKCPRVQA